MHKSILIALLFGAGSAGFASSLAGFTGGRGDGYAHGDFITPPLVSVAAHFLGGVCDGYGSFVYQQATLPAQMRFAGNGYDGYASARFFSVVQTARLKQFSGGNYDGYASSKMFSSWSQNPPKRFLGGSFDGFDRGAVLGVPNWTLGDTDANGLPDWWEFKYFGVIVGTNPNGDPDRDGVSNLNEYLAGTNPTNASSYFHLTRLTPGAPKKIFVACEPGYFYTLQRANDLVSGWTNVAGQIRISSAAEAVLEMDDPSGGPQGFYRVQVEH